MSSIMSNDEQGSQAKKCAPTEYEFDNAPGALDSRSASNVVPINVGALMTVDRYWAALRLIGIKPNERLDQESWIGSCRAGVPVQIEDPDRYSPAEREAIIEKYRKRYEEF